MVADERPTGLILCTISTSNRKSKEKAFDSIQHVAVREDEDGADRFTLRQDVITLHTLRSGP